MEGDIFLGEGEAKFDDKASVVWNNRDILTLWTHKNTHWHTPRRGTLTPSPPSTSSENLRSAFKACFKHRCSDAGCVKGRDPA